MIRKVNIIADFPMPHTAVSAKPIPTHFNLTTAQEEQLLFKFT